LPTGSSARIEWGNTEFIGELIYCQPHGKGNEFLAGLNVETPVYDTKNSTASSKSLI
jgi:hypothetical protein